MLEMVLLDKALCLPAADIAALLSGKLIAALPRVPVQKGWTFALYPYIEATRQQENSHRSNCTVSTSTAIAQASTIEAWATCEQCVMLHSLEQVEALSRSTIWQREALKLALEQRQHLFLAFLRVHRTPELIKVNCKSLNADKFGKFVGLSSLDERFNQPEKITQKLPVLSDRTFAQRRQKLENLEPPDHPELEELHDTIAQLANPAAVHLKQDLKYFLGWAETAIVDRPQPKWIQEIAKAGNSSDGDYFEKLVRKSFIELGFTNSQNNPKMSLDPEATGGAGGIDFFCDAPYRIIGECKASKSQKVADHKDGAPAQLLKFGGSYLKPEEFADSIRIIMAPGEMTDYAKQTAIGHQMNVLQPETLQRLVELKQAYPGAINLWELKSCLSQLPFSQAADDKLNQHLDRIQQEIQVRSRIVEVLQSRAPKELGIDFIWGTYEALNPPRSLTQAELKDILIELSSPLTGFIGRKDSDRFYFLRPLNLES
ncbi:unknown protein [Leptolyngbya sp. NIES-3755]|nr:unknown protein [Leptolyngbya sp. NIES-3755]